MIGIEKDFFSDLEASVEQEEGERSVEHIDYSNQEPNDKDDFDIEESTASSLKTIGEFMMMGEDVDELIDDILINRADVIKKLMQEGKLDEVCDSLRDRIDETLFRKIEEVNNDGEGR